MILTGFCFKGIGEAEEWFFLHKNIFNKFFTVCNNMQLMIQELTPKLWDRHWIWPPVLLVHLVLNGPGLRREILMKQQSSRYEAIVLLTKKRKGRWSEKSHTFGTRLGRWRRLLAKHLTYIDFCLECLDGILFYKSGLVQNLFKKIRYNSPNSKIIGYVTFFICKNWFQWETNKLNKVTQLSDDWDSRPPCGFGLRVQRIIFLFGHRGSACEEQLICSE